MYCSRLRLGRNRCVFGTARVASFANKEVSNDNNQLKLQQYSPFSGIFTRKKSAQRIKEERKMRRIWYYCHEFRF